MKSIERYFSLRGLVVLFLFAVVREHVLADLDSWWGIASLPIVGFIVAYIWPSAFLSGPVGEVVGRFAYHYITGYSLLSFIPEEERPVLGLLFISALYGVAVLLGSIPGSFVSAMVKRESVKKATSSSQ